MKAGLKAILTVVLGVLAVWLVRYGWLERRVFYEDYSFTAAEAQKLARFAKAQYAYGKDAWYGQQAEKAARFFRRAAARDPHYVSAWLRLAEAEKELGRQDKARAIIAFTDRLSGKVLRWKWTQSLLALELGAEEIFWDNLNSLLTHGRKVADAFQVMELYGGVRPAEAVNRLAAGNLEHYLRWLTRWGRTDDSLLVWEAIREQGLADEEQGRGYAGFLLGRGRPARAYAIWRELVDREGTANAGFEKPLSGGAFGWRYRNDGRERWKIERVKSPQLAGEYALQIAFGGQANLNFQPLRRIVPVEEGRHYGLRYWWRSEKITTDQGPFVEIRGYGCKGLHVKGPMMLGTAGWRREVLDFAAPEGCEAVMVRLRRRKSWKFDSKIAGKLWLDEFGLEGREP